jgi:putative SOS response-associated peptidase YedK
MCDWGHSATRCVSAAGGAPLSFAGLWDEWHDVESREIVNSCTIIITAANSFTRRVHERTPVILPQFEPWLKGTAGMEARSDPRRKTCCRCGRCRGA